LHDKNIIFGENDCLYALTGEEVIVKVNMGNLYNDDYIAAFNTYVFKFDKSKFINDKEVYKNYQVGYIVYVGNTLLKEKLFENTEDIFTIELDPITDTDILNKNITEFPYEDEITYNILVYVHKLTGFNIFSHTTTLTCKLEYREKYKLV
jgi:hypothetical protein